MILVVTSHSSLSSLTHSVFLILLTVSGWSTVFWPIGPQLPVVFEWIRRHMRKSWQSRRSSKEESIEPRSVSSMVDLIQPFTFEFFIPQVFIISELLYSIRTWDRPRSSIVLKLVSFPVFSRFSMLSYARTTVYFRGRQANSKSRQHFPSHSSAQKSASGWFAFSWSSKRCSCCKGDRYECFLGQKDIVSIVQINHFRVKVPQASSSAPTSLVQRHSIQSYDRR